MSEKLKLFQKRKKSTDDPYKSFKILHGVQSDKLTSRVRWDENKIVKEYFGTGIKLIKFPRPKLLTPHQ